MNPWFRSPVPRVKVIDFGLSVLDMSGFGYRVSDFFAFEFRDQGSVLRIGLDRDSEVPDGRILAHGGRGPPWGLGLVVWGLGCGVSGLRSEIECLGTGVWG